jgi:hypothetical protein
MEETRGVHSLQQVLFLQVYEASIREIFDSRREVLLLLPPKTGVFFLELEKEEHRKR